MKIPQLKVHSPVWPNVNLQKSGLPSQRVEYAAAAQGVLQIGSPINVDELERIGRVFDVPQLANLLEGGRTPFLTPAELEQIGFRIVI